MQDGLFAGLEWMEMLVEVTEYERPHRLGSRSMSTSTMAGLNEGSLRESATVSKTCSDGAAMRMLPAAWATSSG